MERILWERHVRELNEQLEEQSNHFAIDAASYDFDESAGTSEEVPELLAREKVQNQINVPNHDQSSMIALNHDQNQVIALDLQQSRNIVPNLEHSNKSDIKSDSNRRV